MNDKIADLRIRASADPKSRHFYPLGEELRKSGALEEAESVLREGLANHPNYLSAWISLGRVLRDQNKHREAIEILQRAFSLDGSNVVTARLMAESYLALDDKVEAIKKFKLVRALLPPDEEVGHIIERLERELEPPAPPSPIEPEPALEEPAGSASSFAPDEAVFDSEDAHQGADESIPEQPEPEAASRTEPGIDPGRDENAAAVFVPLTQQQELATSPEPEAESGPFEPFGDDTLTRASAATATEEDPFGLGGDEEEAGSDSPMSSAAPEDDSPFGDQTLIPRSAEPPPADLDATQSLEIGAAALDEPTSGEGDATAADARVMRLNSWLARVRRNAGVS